jgi:hypothetical protein
MLTNQQKERVIAAIKRREARLETQRAELQQLRSQHEAAWHMYGSELCAGDMLRQERQLSDRCIATQREIDLLKRCLHGETPMQADPGDEARIRCLQDDEAHIQGELHRARARALICKEIERLLDS